MNIVKAGICFGNGSDSCMQRNRNMINICEENILLLGFTARHESMYYSQCNNTNLGQLRSLKLWLCRCRELTFLQEQK